MNPGGNEERLECLDNLRAVVVFLIIVLHGSMIFMTYAPDWWYVVHSNTSMFFTVLVLVLDVPLYLILFFIAGYYIYPLLVELRPNGFMRASLRSIAVPWIIGVFLLAPPVGYLTLYTRDMPVPYALFLEEHFWRDYFTQSVYWFLGILLILYGTVTLVYYSSVSFRSLHFGNQRPTWLSIAVFLGIISACAIAVNFSVSADQWRHYGYLIMVQPVRAPLYAGFFALGIFAFINGWFTIKGYRPDLKLWIPLAMYAAILYSIARVLLDRSMGPEPAVNAVLIITMTIFGYSSLMGLIAVSLKYLDFRNSFWKSLSRNWYGMYFIHPLVLFPVALLFLPLDISIYIKAPAVIIISWLFTWLISTAIMTKAPALRDIF